VAAENVAVAASDGVGPPLFLLMELFSSLAFCR
jgi:hypothetical protein